jgi:long-chain acyl-CoA synthetase
MKKIQNMNTTKVKHFICMDNISVSSFNFYHDLISTGKQLLENGNNDFLNATIEPEKMSILLFTSGTTSLSKAVMLSHKNICSNIYAMQRFIKIYDTDVNMAFLPFHHTFGCTGLLLFLSNGSTNVFCDGLRHIQQNLKEYQVSIFVCVPLLLESMYKQIQKTIDKTGKRATVEKGLKISKSLLKVGIDIRRKLFKEIIDNLGGKLRFVISGAASIDTKVIEDFNDLGITTIQGYGLTETSPVLIGENEFCIKHGSVGFPLCNIDIKIDNPNENGIGEIIAKGPNVMLGYYNNEEATNEVLIDGWFHTGDLGYIDNDGYIFVTGRKKNVIVLKNGKNIYPEELESLINNLIYVSECMVFGLPKDDDLLLSAKIVYNKDYIKETYPNISEKDLYDIIWNDIKKINSTLTNFKHIKNIIITDEPMIKTTTAKIKRFQEIEKIINENK